MKGNERPTKAELSSLYSKDGLSISNLAKCYGVAAGVVTRWLKEDGISIRMGVNGRLPPTPPREELVALYENDALSMLELAAHYEISSWSVARWMDEYDIPRRKFSKRSSSFHSKEELYELYVVQRISITELAISADVSKATVGRRLKENGIKRVRRGITPHPREAIVEMYVTNGMSLNGIGDVLGVSPATIGRWMNAYGIPRRGHGEGGGRE